MPKFIALSFALAISSLSLVVSNCCGQVAPDKLDPSDTFATTIRPLLDRYCSQCHEPNDQQVEFLWPTTHVQAKQLPNSFASVFRQLDDKTMPPADAEQPSAAQRKLIMDWIDDTFHFQAADFDRLSAYVVEAFEDSKGNLWFGTVTDGAARFDGELLTWYSTKNGLRGDTVTSITEDQQGSIWLGTDGGVSKFDGASFTTYSNERGLPDTRCYVLVDRNNSIWAGSERGVFRFDGSRFTKFDVPEPAIDVRSWKVEFGKVWCLTEDRHGNIWFGRDGLGATRFDGKSFKHFTTKDGLCSNNVSSIVEDKQGNMWIGCLSSDYPAAIAEGGLNRFDGQSMIKFPETKGLFNTDIYTIGSTKSGSVWIGATGVGLYRYDEAKFTLFNETDKSYWTRYVGIQSYLEDRNGIVWIGFSGGLFRFNGKSFSNVGRADLLKSRP